MVHPQDTLTLHFYYPLGPERVIEGLANLKTHFEGLAKERRNHPRTEACICHTLFRELERICVRDEIPSLEKVWGKGLSPIRINIGMMLQVEQWARLPEIKELREEAFPEPLYNEWWCRYWFPPTADYALYRARACRIIIDEIHEAFCTITKPCPWPISDNPSDNEIERYALQSLNHRTQEK